ncbi:MAG: hypothetical protein QMD04_10600 [Anaerolineales bacterium]|nr:hypothetical protein [Anaerolineales bacterium]
MIPIYWHCPNGHILGVIEKYTYRNTLRVYRAAVFHETDPGAEFASDITGEAVVYCSLCGAARKWHYSDLPSRRLLNRRQKN